MRFESSGRGADVSLRHLDDAEGGVVGFLSADRLRDRQMATRAGRPDSGVETEKELVDRERNLAGFLGKG